MVIPHTTSATNTTTITATITLDCALVVSSVLVVTLDCSLVSVVLVSADGAVEGVVRKIRILTCASDPISTVSLVTHTGEVTWSVGTGSISVTVTHITLCKEKTKWTVR